MGDRIETQSELWWAKGYAKGIEENAKSLAEARAQVAALTAERDTAKAELAAAKQDTELLSEAARALTEAMDTCHQCGSGLLVDEGPNYCEDSCSADCHGHEDPVCAGIDVLHANLKRLLAARAPEGTEGKVEKPDNLPASPEPVKWGKLDHRGEFDEVWVRNAFVHVERMDETAFWIGIDLPDGNRISINTGVYRGEWFFNVAEDGGQSFSVRRPRNSKTKLPSNASLAQGIRRETPQAKTEERP